MRLATIRTAGGTRAARIDGDTAWVLDASDAGQVIGPVTEGSDAPGGSPVPLDDVDFAPAVPAPRKILCVGLNYKLHLQELGLEPPRYPTLFAKFASTLLGPYDDLVLPSYSDKIDWEVELAAIIGRRVHRAGAAEARAAIGGYTVANDVTVRDWQKRTSEWLQGKALDASTPLGPVIVTPDEIGHADDLEVRCEIDGRVAQRARTSDLLFTPTDLVAYISQFAALEPGDVVLCGTPGGVGDVSGVYIEPGQVVRTVIEGIGECRNTAVPEKI